MQKSWHRKSAIPRPLKSVFWFGYSRCLSDHDDVSFDCKIACSWWDLVKFMRMLIWTRVEGWYPLVCAGAFIRSDARAALTWSFEPWSILENHNCTQLKSMFILLIMSAGLCNCVVQRKSVHVLERTYGVEQQIFDDIQICLQLFQVKSGDVYFHWTRGICLNDGQLVECASLGSFFYGEWRIADLRLTWVFLSTMGKIVWLVNCFVLRFLQFPSLELDFLNIVRFSDHRTMA